MLEECEVGGESPLEGTVEAVSWAFITIFTEVLKHLQLTRRELVITKALSPKETLPFDFLISYSYQDFMPPSSAGLVIALVSGVAM